MKAYFSNQLELLLQFLKSDLYHSPPFARRLIAVPGPALKAWLTLALAKDSDMQIAMGIEIHFASPLMKQLREELTDEKAQTPSFFELALRIEKELATIESIYSSLTAREKSIWHPVVHYLQGRKKRLAPLAEQTAHLFQSYGHYGGQMIEEWEQLKTDSWQRALWKRFFSDGNWRCDAHLFSSFTPSKKRQRSTSLHLFGCSALSPLYMRFLHSISSELPISHYLLSPTQEFWSDIRSEREKQSLLRSKQKQGAGANELDELDAFLSEAHPLLANLGRLGREQMYQVEELECETEELYLPVNQTDPTLLSTLQTDLLLMQQPEEKKILPSRDRSLQFSHAHTRAREVEILLNSLLSLFQQGTLEPGDVLVMAPDLSLYVPFIHTFFREIPFEIIDQKPRAQEPFIHAFLQLLSLASSRWKASSLFALFTSPSFQKKQKWGKEELREIKRWIEEGEIRWGYDSAHRKEMVEGTPASHGTWQQGTEHLLQSSVRYVEERGEIAPSRYTLLGNWIALVRGLREDLLPIEKDLSLTLAEWSDYLELLLSSYFVPDRDEEASASHLRKELRSLGSGGPTVNDQTFPFSTLLHYLSASLAQPSASYRMGNINAVRFSSLLPTRAHPAKVIALIGMQEGSFPRQGEKSSLNLMQGYLKRDYCPTETELDRYLFLELLLSTRHTLLLSMTKEQENTQPSSLITDLFSFLDRSYQIGEKTISEACIYTHPFSSFDPSYFTKEASHPSYSTLAYEIATSKKRKAPVPQNSRGKKPRETTLVHLNELHSFARNPLKPFLHTQLSIQLPNRERKLCEDTEAFLLSSLEHALLKRQALHTHPQTIGETISLPPGPLREISLAKLQAEVEGWETLFHALQIDRNALCTLTLSPLVTEKTEVEEGQWLLPPLEIPSTSLKIVGTLPTISPKGWIVPSKDDPTELLKVWPLYLLFHHLVQKHDLPFVPDLIFLGSGTIKNAFSTEPETMLETYLHYYLSGHQELSPLLPEWIYPLLTQPPQQFEKKVDALFHNPFIPVYNREARWLHAQGKLPTNKEAYERWKPEAVQLFEKIYRHWYPKKHAAIEKEERNAPD